LLFGFRHSLEYGHAEKRFQFLRTFDFEAGEFTSPTPAPIAPTPAVAKFSAFSQRNDFTPEQRQIENLADDMLTHLKPPLQDAAIAAAIRGATDPEDLIARLAVVLKDADYAEFTQQVELCLFAADVMGYAHAD
jgi:phage gp29-like protein